MARKSDYQVNGFDIYQYDVVQIRMGTWTDYSSIKNEDDAKLATAAVLRDPVGFRIVSADRRTTRLPEAND